MTATQSKPYTTQMKKHKKEGSDSASGRHDVSIGAMIQTLNQQPHQLDVQLIARNPLQAQNFGRRIYSIHHARQIWWLKIHLNHVNRISQQAFLNEINVYRQIAQQNSQVLLPFHIVQFKQPVEREGVWLNTALLVRNSRALFATSPAQLADDQVLQVLLRSLDCLEQLHQLGWIHGDLKVEHFRCYCQRSYLIDLEQASPVSQLNIQSSATPRYMAPEIFHGESKTIQSDLYALGIIWLEWLSQQRLQRKSYLDWAYLHCQQLEVRLPTRFFALESVLKAVLMKNKAQRCLNIYQVKQLLSKIV